MFDTITEYVKAFISEALVAFLVASFLGNILIQLVEARTVDFAQVINITITAVVVGVLFSVVIGALRGATK